MLKVNKRVINLYAVPSEVIPEEVQINQSACRIPVGLLPDVIHRSDADVKGKVAGLFEWFALNLVEEDGFLVASAALPALSLDKAVWGQAMTMLRGVLEKYEKVVGPVFVPSLSATRTDKFAVADLYTKLLQGSTMLPVVTYKQERVWEAEPAVHSIDDTEDAFINTGNTMPNNHVDETEEKAL